MMDDEEIDILGNDDGVCPIQISTIIPVAVERNEWSFEEKRLFEIGYEELGSKWSKIANLIQSKSANEVQIYAKNYLRTDSQNITVDDQKVSLSTSEITRIKKIEDDQEDIDIGFDIEGPSSSSFPENVTIKSSDPSNSISDEEKQIHTEFFSGNTKKSPERYIRIKSHILKAWDKCKPQYLSKVAARHGLRNCGDINSVGKIHSYLENIGVININCDLQRRKTIVKKKTVTLSPKTMSLRKRNSTGNKLENMEMRDKGVTIEHGEDGSEINRMVHTEKRIKISSPKKNPFQLVSCYAYNESKPPPFELSVDLQAQILAETHCFIFASEVIGLFGGRYNPEVCELEIQFAVPCKSLSTGVECEMDPVSQSEASELIQSMGLRVVGWYHSHPTVPPTPSVRDLETQLKYQEMFEMQKQQPFVSLIISPFIKNAPISKLCWWLLESKYKGTDREPYEIDCNFSNKQQLEIVVDEIEKLVHIEKDSRQRIKMVETEKLLNSLKMYSTKAGIDEEVFDSIGKRITQILTRD